MHDGSLSGAFPATFNSSLLVRSSLGLVSSAYIIMQTVLSSALLYYAML